MTDVLISASAHAFSSEVSQVDITVFVQDSDWSGLYNKLQVFRSTQGEAGPYEELTDDVWSPPRLPQDGGDPPNPSVTGGLVNIVGKELQLLINYDTLIVTFTGSDPLTLTQVASQIATQSTGRLTSYVASDGRLIIENVWPGLMSRLEVLESDGATILNLPVGESARGRDPRFSLVPGQQYYALRDYFGSSDFFYRSRFYNTVTGAQSDPSTAVGADPAQSINAGIDNVVIGYVNLLRSTGKPHVGAEVRVYNEFSGLTPIAAVVTGGDLIEFTDESGHAEFSLIRGQKVTVSVQGTPLVRSVTVPTDPSVKLVDLLLDPSIGDPDVFKAMVPDLIVAERRTL